MATTKRKTRSQIAAANNQALIEDASKVALHPAIGLLVKLGSIAVHADEMLSPDGHAFDRTALEQLLIDQDVKAWLAAMDILALIPKKRKD